MTTNGMTIIDHTISDSEMRVLVFLRRYPGFHHLGTFGQIIELTPGDVASLGGLIGRGFVVWSDNTLSAAITNDGAARVPPDVVEQDCSPEHLAKLIRPLTEEAEIFV